MKTLRVYVGGDTETNNLVLAAMIARSLTKHEGMSNVTGRGFDSVEVFKGAQQMFALSHEYKVEVGTLAPDQMPKDVPAITLPRKKAAALVPGDVVMPSSAFDSSEPNLMFMSMVVIRHDVEKQQLQFGRPYMDVNGYLDHLAMPLVWAEVFEAHYRPGEEFLFLGRTAVLKLK